MSPPLADTIGAELDRVVELHAEERNRRFGRWLEGGVEIVERHVRKVVDGASADKQSGIVAAPVCYGHDFEVAVVDQGLMDAFEDLVPLVVRGVAVGCGDDGLHGELSEIEVGGREEIETDVAVVEVDEVLKALAAIVIAFGGCAADGARGGLVAGSEGEGDQQLAVGRRFGTFGIHRIGAGAQRANHDAERENKHATPTAGHDTSHLNRREGGSNAI